MLVFFVVSILLSALASLATAAQIPMRTAQTACSWYGFGGLSYIFSFGDSYTMTGFEPLGPPPSRDNPMGNPMYPGRTSSNGPNWIDYLTFQYNQSLIQTVNLAAGGATVDPVQPSLPNVPTVKQQVFDIFLPNYGSGPVFLPWTGQNTLFTFFVGINDVAGSWDKNTDLLYDYIFSTYAACIHALYRAGGRNFLFLNVPPMHRAPKSGGMYRGKYLSRIYDWNDRIAKLVSELTSVYADITATVFDTYLLYDQTLDNPSINALTAPYKDTTGWCGAYANGTPKPDSKYPWCEYAADEYFWLNEGHSTFRIHEATAQAVAKQLKELPDCTTR